jgi:hypothetical protein
MCFQVLYAPSIRTTKTSLSLQTRYWGEDPVDGFEDFALAAAEERQRTSFGNGSAPGDNDIQHRNIKLRGGIVYLP